MQNAEEDDGVFGDTVEDEMPKPAQAKRSNARAQFMSRAADFRKAPNSSLDLIEQSVCYDRIAVREIGIGFGQIVEKRRPANNVHPALLVAASAGRVAAKHLRLDGGRIPRTTGPLASA
jgi:hypothetical protein